MKRELSTLAIAAVLLGGTLAGCGGASNGDPASSAQVTAALRTSAAEMEPEVSTTNEHEMEGAVSRFTSVMNQLRQVPALQPLFDHFQIPNPIVFGDDAMSAGLIAMLHSVQFGVSNGTLTLVNRATGGIIYSAPWNDLSAGVFHPENMPGSTTPPPPAACTYTYSPWSACSGGTQTRTVASATPAGCTGTPVLSQSCTVTPPPPTACTSWTTGAWTPAVCDATQTQTRTVTTTPAGCTGTPTTPMPATTQSCTYVPPPVACTGWTTGPLTPAICPASGQQTQTVTAVPAGCTGTPPGTKPPTTVSCTPPPPPNPVTSANIVSSCTGCHGLTSNTTVFKSGGYTVTGRASAQWLSTVNSMVSMGASLAPGTTAQNYADYLANVP